MSPAVVMGCIKWLLPAVHRRPGSVHVGKVCAGVTDDTVYLNSSAATKKPGGLLHTSRCPSIGCLAPLVILLATNTSIGGTVERP